MVSGTLKPTEGQVLLNGRVPRESAIGIRRQIMLLEPDMPRVAGSTYGHIGTLLSLFQCTREGIENVALNWVDEFDLTLRITAESGQHLSRGLRMKLWLACLLTIRPKLWLLDEPHQSGLDARGIEILESEMKKHRDAGGTIVFTTQYPPHAIRLAGRAIVLNQGELAFCGEIDELAAIDTDPMEESTAAIVRSLGRESGDVL